MNVGSWNNAIQPEYNAVEHLSIDKELAKKFIISGFGTINSLLDDGIVNGTSVLFHPSFKKIHESFGNRSLEPRQSIVPVTLNEGWNSIILKIVNSSGPWGLSCRIRGRNGDPIDELKIDSGQKIKR